MSYSAAINVPRRLNSAAFRATGSRTCTPLVVPCRPKFLKRKRYARCPSHSGSPLRKFPHSSTARPRNPGRAFPRRRDPEPPHSTRKSGRAIDRLTEVIEAPSPTSTRALCPRASSCVHALAVEKPANGSSRGQARSSSRSRAFRSPGATPCRPAFSSRPGTPVRG